MLESSLMPRKLKKLSVTLDSETDRKVELEAKAQTKQRKKEGLPRPCVSKSELIGNLVMEHFS